MGTNNCLLFVIHQILDMNWLVWLQGSFLLITVLVVQVHTYNSLFAVPKPQGLWHSSSLRRRNPIFDPKCATNIHQSKTQCGSARSRGIYSADGFEMADDSDDDEVEVINDANKDDDEANSAPNPFQQLILEGDLNAGATEEVSPFDEVDNASVETKPTTVNSEWQRARDEKVHSILAIFL